jgi:hypothetical protein
METRRLDRPAIRCRAHNRLGEPCAAFAIRGARVCVAHGGSAPQVKAAADRRITELYGTAIDTLERAMQDNDPFVRRSAVEAAKLVVQYQEGMPKQRLEAALLGAFTLRINRDPEPDGAGD